MMHLLFKPLQIRGVELKNRIAVSPMCQYSSTDGFATDWHLVHLGSRAVGGAGLVMSEAAAVSPQGRITANDLGIWKDEHISFLKRITDFIVMQESVPGIQLAHAGRKASHQSPWKGNEALTKETGAWETISASPIAYKNSEPIPGEMSMPDIATMIENFRDAAQRATEAGFKIIEIHAAHGYLINEFLSPLSNFRTDQYGGSFVNRIRILMEIVVAIRKVIPLTMPLFVRISATDWVIGGWTVADSVALASELQLIGVDLIDCSSGGNSTLQKILPAPLYQVSFAEEVKKQTGMLTAAVGLITNEVEASKILENGQADIIFMARQFLREPYFPLHAAKKLGQEIRWPVQYERAKF